MIERPTGLAEPLGFCGLATASVLLAAQHLGWISGDATHVVALAVLVSVVPLQALGAVFSLVSGETVTATASAVLSSTWAAEAVVSLSSPPGSTSDPLGVFLLAASVALFVPVAAGLRARPAPAAVPGLAAVSFVLTALYQLTAGALARHAGGIVELCVAALALSVAFSLTLEQSRRQSA